MYGVRDPGKGQHSWTLNEKHSREIIKHGLELGVNFYDTAIGYQSGTSEQYVGRAIRDYAKREDVVVATKFMPRTKEDKKSGETSKRLQEDSYAKLKYDGTAQQDQVIIWRVAELAEKRGEACVVCGKTENLIKKLLNVR